jgi:hypothetical protein
MLKNLFKKKNVITDEMEQLYKLKDIVQVYDLNIKELEKRIIELEKVVFALKGNVKEEKQKQSVNKAKKWLTGYPDESDKV